VGERKEEEEMKAFELGLYIGIGYALVQFVLGTAVSVIQERRLIGKEREAKARLRKEMSLQMAHIQKAAEAASKDDNRGYA
jgi:hypothetical protein